MELSPTTLHRGQPSNVSAWAVFAWPSVLWQAPCPPKLQLLHLGTYITSFGSQLTPCSGQTVWGEPPGNNTAGLAWDWIELSQGIIAMADPMAVITNVRFLGPDGGVLTPIEAAPRLNEVVHSLPWQSKVQQVLHSEVQRALQQLEPRH